jgi:hypothetical protein
MNNNLGRDKVWNEATWQDIDTAVLGEVRRIRVAQKSIGVRLGAIARLRQL